MTVKKAITARHGKWANSYASQVAAKLFRDHDLDELLTHNRVEVSNALVDALREAVFDGALREAAELPRSGRSAGPPSIRERLDAANPPIRITRRSK